jgi:hypothetical protein
MTVCVHLYCGVCTHDLSMFCPVSETLFLRYPCLVCFMGDHKHSLRNNIISKMEKTRGRSYRISTPWKPFSSQLEYYSCHLKRLPMMLKLFAILATCTSVLATLEPATSNTKGKYPSVPSCSRTSLSSVVSVTASHD